MSESRTRIIDGLTLVIAASALAMTSVALLDRRAGATAQPSTQSIPNWQQYASAGQRTGPREADATIVVFGDYQCPACKHFEGVLRAVRSARAEDFAVVYRHWPLPYHLEAYPAARAAECAAAQNHFLPYHELLYDQTDLAGADWVGLALQAGVADPVAFSECVSEQDPVPTIESDMEAAQTLGARGTPTILVNDRMLLFVPDSVGLERVIREATRP